MLTPNILKRMRAAAPLLPPPGDTELIKCLDEIDRLTEALDSTDKMVGEEINHSEALEECLLRAVSAVDPDWEWSNLKTPNGAVQLIVDHINALQGTLEAERKRAFEAGQLSHQYRNERDAVLRSKCALDAAMALTLVSERDQLKARVAELERQIVGEMNQADEHRKERDQLKAQVTELTQELASETKQADHHALARKIAESECDAARAELAALKARKVKIPTDPHNGDLFIYHRADIIALCRAAGVEVES